MVENKYLLSNIQKESYEKALETKIKLDEVFEELGINHKGREGIDTYIREVLVWKTYESQIFKDEVWNNLVNDNGYQPFKELAHNYILCKKEQGVYPTEQDYNRDFSLIETGKFPEGTKKKIKKRKRKIKKDKKGYIVIDSVAAGIAFICGTAFSGGDPRVGAEFVRELVKRKKITKKGHHY